MTRPLESMAALAVVVAVLAGRPPLRAQTAPAPPASPVPDHGASVTFTESEIRRILRHSPLADPPPATNAYAKDPRAARLGQRLFYDPRLSRDGQVSCATCHDPARGFADGKPIAEGAGTGTRHTLSLWNVAYNRWYFWDGRADSLWAQALHPIEHHAEMSSSRLRLLHQVHRDPALRRDYEFVFGALPDLSDRRRFPAEGRPVPGDPGHAHHRAWTSMAEADRAAADRAFANLGKAIAAFERRLVSRDAPFDRFVEGLRTGDPERMAALPPAAQRGLRLFIGKGECRLCHVGPNFTDGEFHDIRVAPRHGGTPRDPGRFGGVPLLQRDPFNATGAFSDDPEAPAARQLEFLVNGPQNWGRFKTPSLRNVALTAPYMHQGQFATLADVIDYYSTLDGALQLDHHDETILVPRHFTDDEKRDLLAFLESLTDVSVAEALLRKPED